MPDMSDAEVTRALMLHEWLHDPKQGTKRCRELVAAGVPEELLPPDIAKLVVEMNEEESDAKET